MHEEQKIIGAKVQNCRQSICEVAPVLPACNSSECVKYMYREAAEIVGKVAGFLYLWAQCGGRVSIE